MINFTIVRYDAESIIDSRLFLERAEEIHKLPNYTNREFDERAFLRAALVFAWIGFDAMVRRQTNQTNSRKFSITRWLQTFDTGVPHIYKPAATAPLLKQLTTGAAFSAFNDVEKLSISREMRNALEHPEELDTVKTQLLYAKLEPEIIKETLRIMESIGIKSATIYKCGWQPDFFSKPTPWKH
ncbi:MAG: hypothetical protein J4203_07640 [Candidatus Diapherotrites archaeon]|uniref:Uncharacterized protein n=1 Tax=Candidatus Iainarchaeum sp. TaxID=3101447 RepID=A0A8T4L8W1_9ARCH|nr:hypothetical protein [Candidatus Diapherotrites archaeon]